MTQGEELSARAARAERLATSVRRQRERRERWQRDGNLTLPRSLALVGTLGWLLVAPALLGVLLGRWLDRRYQSGVFWSATLLFAGVIAGGSFLWKRVHQK
jgi:ATP synthase protein I